MGVVSNYLWDHRLCGMSPSSFFFFRLYPVTCLGCELEEEKKWDPQFINTKPCVRYLDIASVTSNIYVMYIQNFTQQIKLTYDTYIHRCMIQSRCHRVHSVCQPASIYDMYIDMHLRVVLLLEQNHMYMDRISFSL